MSIAAMRQEIQSQPESLAKITHELAKSTIQVPKHRQVVFTGSGDSWAAALFARELAKRDALSEDPAELSSTLAFAKKKSIVIISTSGRTRANLDLAKKAKLSRIKTIAVTSSSKSPLARICDDSIILHYRKAAVLTAGTISFTASLLACAKLIRRLPNSLPLERAKLDVEKKASRVRLHGRGKCIFVGSGVDRALAEYGACKIQEVLGTTAFATYPEQLGHAILFSLDPGRDSIVCVSTTGSTKTRELYGRLLRAKFRAYNVSSVERDLVVKSLAACFQLQYIALLNAERSGQTECAFLRDKSRLKLSNQLIY